jgi:DNA-binding phage protein
MALTRRFRATVMARVRSDPRFRESLLSEALNCFLSGDMGAGKAMLRDFVNATDGFESLARDTGLPSKSIHRMLGARGNPSTENLFAIVRVLQSMSGLRLEVTAHPARRKARRS